MGGVRTALYNYLFAKKHGGDFVLRIEDTDQGRFVPGAEDYIIESLKWCGIMPNEGVGFGDGPHAPYRQSERKSLYLQYAEQLIASGHAYYAFDTAEQMDALRKAAEAQKQTWQYDATVRMGLQNSLTLPAEEVELRKSRGEAYVIRLKVEPGELIQLNDLVRGEVVFKSDIVDDKVLLKGDGMPTYHLAHIIDDVLMNISHAVRGEEWLPSAPAHVLIYRYLGWEDKMPRYAHLPLLLKPDGNGKLSKRDGDRLGFPVFPLDWQDPNTGELSSGYRERGYYPDAFVNMLAFLGWNPGTEQEIFTLEELAGAFSFEHIHKAGARFDPEKAKWFNEQYLRHRPSKVIAASIRSQVQQHFDLEEGDNRLSASFLETAVELLKPRVQFDYEMVEKGFYLWQSPTLWDDTVISKKWKPDLKAFFVTLQEAFEQAEAFSASDAETTFKKHAEHCGVKPGDVLQLFRVMVSGQGSGIDLFGMVALLGKKEVIHRISNAIRHINS